MRFYSFGFLRMRKSILILAALILIPSVLQADPVRIGVLTDLSGAMASWGQQTKLGAFIAKDEIAKSGASVELLFGDHQLQAKHCISEFQKLLELDRIDALYVEFTPCAVAVAPIAAGKGIPIIYSAAAVSPTTLAAHIFKTYLDYFEGCRLLAQNWKSGGVRSVGFMKVNLEFGELCKEGLAKVYPDFIEVVYNPGDEIASSVLSLKQKGVEAVLNVAFEPDLLRTLKNMQNLGWRPLVGTQEDAVAEQGQKLFPEMLKHLSTFSLPALPEEFIERIRKRDPKNSLVSISAAGLAYVHVKQLFAARAACSTGELQCMRQSIAAAGPDSTTGFEGWKGQTARFAIRIR